MDFLGALKTLALMDQNDRYGVHRNEKIDVLLEET